MEIIENIMAYLSAPELKRIQTMTDRLVELNQKTSGNPSMCVMHRGNLLRHTKAPKGRHIWPALDMMLYGEAEGFMAHVRSVEHELQIIKQCLVSLVRDLHTAQDIRDALPECLVHILEGHIKTFPRTREAAWNLEPGTRIHRLYEKILPKLEYYTAARIVY